MADRIMVDTNIMLYAYDGSEPIKQPKAVAIMDRLVGLNKGVLTPQILAEFFVNATRKLEPPLTMEEACVRIQNYLLSWHVLDVTGPIVMEATRGTLTYQMSYWDAQIWASARLNQVPIIMSEDFNAGAVIEGVRFINPLVDDFDLNAWLPK